MSEKNNNKNGLEGVLKSLSQFQGMLFSAIMSLDYDDLDDMINTGEMPQILNLIEFGEQINLLIYHNIKRAIYNKRNEIIPLLTVERLIEYGIQYGRPDLAKRISMADGRKWMKSVIEYAKIIVNNLNLNSAQIRVKIAEYVKKNRMRKAKLRKEAEEKRALEEQLKQIKEQEPVAKIDEELENTLKEDLEDIDINEIEEDNKENDYGDDMYGV